MTPFPLAILSEMHPARHPTRRDPTKKIARSRTHRDPDSAFNNRDNRENPCARARCFNHRFNGAFAVHLLANVGESRGRTGESAGGCAPRSHIYPRSLPVFFFFAAAYLRGLVTRRYYSGIHVPADRENCDYL